MTRLTLAAAVLMLAAGPALAQDAPAPGDPALGEKVFVKCRAGHQIGPTAHNAVGPVLSGVIGRHSGTYPGYDYSDANKNSGLTWDEATFRRYIQAPQAVVPGTKMTFTGLTKQSDVNNIVAYLKQFDADGNKH